jgi:uncharacterized repeat protein (TIGR03803 family)
MKLRLAPLLVLAFVTPLVLSLASAGVGTGYRNAAFLAPSPHRVANCPLPKGPSLTQWTDTYAVNGANYTAIMVGNNVTSNSTTTVIAEIIPIVMVYNTNNGKVTFNPETDVTPNGDTVIEDIKESPLFDGKLHWKEGKFDVGQTQYVDAFQRANFWSTVSNNQNYHVVVQWKPLSKKQITVDPSQGGIINNPFGPGQVGTMDMSAFDAHVQCLMQIYPQINPSVVPIFVTDNVYLTQGNLYFGGYHSATAGAPNGQTYIHATYITEPNVFAQDVSALSHEIAEWMDDPFVGNSAACGRVEVGDPLENDPNWGDFVRQLGPRTYHLQNLAFLPYFGAPTGQSVNNWLDFKNRKKSACWSVLYAFQGGNDGSSPQAGLMLGNDGNLYGTTYLGGGTDCGGTGCGTVFKIAPNGTKYSKLYSFTGGNDGADVAAGLIADGAGNLYGTASYGANDGGTVFKLAQNGTNFVSLHIFAGNDGWGPYASLISDGVGNLYGTTQFGGDANNGTVFMLASNGTNFSLLHAFQGGSGDGHGPFSNLIMDRVGNLYGTTTGGGPYGGAFGFGSLFKLAADGSNYSVLHFFTGGIDGANPSSGLIADSAGNLYGVAGAGGGNGCFGSGCGTVFEVAPDGTSFLQLHAFNGADGSYPSGDLLLGNDGYLYGATDQGGACCGNLFRLGLDGSFSVLHSFQNGNDGSFPAGALISDGAGNLYGTVSEGGNGFGYVFKITPNP